MAVPGGRGAIRETAILRATLELLAESGYDQLTIDAVAARDAELAAGWLSPPLHAPATSRNTAAQTTTRRSSTFAIAVHRFWPSARGADRIAPRSVAETQHIVLLRERSRL